MHGSSRRGLADIPVGVALVATGLLLSHSGRQFFGLSPDFSSGLMIGAGIGVLLVALAFSIRARRNLEGSGG